MNSYNLNPEFNPKGDQSRAIDLLCENLLNEKKKTNAFRGYRKW